MNTPMEATRSAVAQVWQGVLDGTISRDEAHRWAAPWVEGDSGVEDPMTNSGLQHLHGFDLVWVDDARTTVRHGGGGLPAHTRTDVQQAFAAWRTACDSYDADPAGYLRRVKAAALAALSEESR
ncbi:hypothetical protein V5P93_003007 [Actinokineospora auranticolor]|uniref:Uncharacterized protein n=1 Tax=Actinokineospora auranticolor TaxID=155976 RepID=A0A2S6H110_9PSEU|nr:hypothetical protein [Actinokineospora auranticolor]PPK71144.1 hypothetical protein CLV40_101333 [Actinokineospora auranticolor]